MKKLMKLVCVFSILVLLSGCSNFEEHQAKKVLKELQNVWNINQLSNSTVDYFEDESNGQIFDKTAIGTVEKANVNNKDFTSIILLGANLEDLNYNNSNFWEAYNEYIMRSKASVFSGDGSISIDVYLSAVKEFYYSDFTKDLHEIYPYKDTKNLIENNFKNVIIQDSQGGYNDDKKSNFQNENYWFNPLSNKQQSFGEVGTYNHVVDYTFLGDLRIKHTVKYWYDTDLHDENNEVSYALYYKDKYILSGKSSIEDFLNMTQNNVRVFVNESEKMYCAITNESIFVLVDERLYNIKRPIEEINNELYETAIELQNTGNFADAIQTFEKLGDYKDSASCITECYYKYATELKENGNIHEAIFAFRKAFYYEDSAEQLRILAGKSLSAGGLHTVGVNNDGTVVAAGYNDDGRCDVGSWTDIVSVAAGENHTVGLRADGTVVATKYTGKYPDAFDYGQSNVTNWKNIISISAGNGHTVGLCSDGTVVATGSNEEGQCNVREWSNIVDISATEFVTFGLKADGTVISTWKENSFASYFPVSQCKVSDWTDIIAISAGYGHTIGLSADGTVLAVGNTNKSECNVTDWENIVEVSAGFDHTVGLSSSGKVVATGTNRNGECNVRQWSDIVSISAGFDQTIGLRSDGTVVAVGRNDYGQCDVTDWTHIRVPGK